MFTKSLEEVSQFTLPVIISKRYMSGDVEAGCATFIILNSDGWVLTSAHVLGDLLKAKEDAKKVKTYNDELEMIKSDSKLNAKQKNKQLSRHKSNSNPKWILNHSYWWGRDGVTTKEWFFDPLSDLAISRLEPFEGNTVSTYPRFRDLTNPLKTGASLCRLGFPFHAIKASFDESSNSFKLAEGTLPMPRFPIEGIHTRVAIIEDATTKRKTKFIETSSPGLRGQSGGPVFDTDGRVCGLQSRTSHLPLGFSPTVIVGSKEIQENQFINVGLATHVEEIVRLLKEKMISFKTA